MGKRRYGLDEIQRISGRKYSLVSNTGDWEYGKSGHHKVGDYYPYDIAKRVIKKYLGKSFDDAFSYYCTLVPKYMQHIFLEEFQPSRYSWYRQSYYINSNKIICESKPNKRKKYSLIVKSPDYTYVIVHKITGHKKSNFREVYEQEHYEYKRKHFTLGYDIVTKGYKNGKFLYYEYGSNPFHMKPLSERYIAKEEDFIERTLTGWKREFYSKNDPYYKRYKRIADQLWKKKREVDRIAREQKLQEALKLKEEELKLKKLQNETKIIKHGFDPITSFRK